MISFLLPLYQAKPAPFSSARLSMHPTWPPCPVCFCMHVSVYGNMGTWGKKGIGL